MYLHCSCHVAQESGSVYCVGCLCCSSVSAQHLNPATIITTRASMHPDEKIPGVMCLMHCSIQEDPTPKRCSTAGYSMQEVVHPASMDPQECFVSAVQLPLYELRRRLAALTKPTCSSVDLQCKQRNRGVAEEASKHKCMSTIIMSTDSSTRVVYFVCSTVDSTPKGSRVSPGVESILRRKAELHRYSLSSISDPRKQRTTFNPPDPRTRAHW